MLPELVKFEEEVTLIMGSGVQFLDFGVKLDPRKETGEFGEQPGAKSLARLEEDVRRDRHVHPGRPDVGVKPILSVRADESLKLLTDVWLPIPMLRTAAAERYEEGPSNWARVRVVGLAPGEDPDDNTHRITIACDTRVYPKKPGSLYLAPTTEDVKGGAPFCLAHRAHWMGWFLETAWIESWIKEVFEESAARRLRKDREDIDLDLASRLHQAHYLNLLHLVGVYAKPPKIKIISNTGPEDRYQPIPVDLVLDVGNSRTCGVLIEVHPQETDGLKHRYVLELRDLSQPQNIYTEPFESRLEFAQAMFGKENWSAQSGRRDAFVWPTMARVGKEATRLASRRRGTEGSTGISSPKRYLWDTEPYPLGWRLNCAFGHSEAGEPLATVAPFSDLINDVGEVLYALETIDRQPVFTPRYSRSSLMMFMLSEVLTQALMQINSPSQRLKQSHANLPRHLRSITLTVPPSMPKPERDIFRERITQAMHLVWKCMDWHPPHAKIDDASAEPFPPFPKIRVEWDEATCGQVVYLYTEIQNNFSGRPNEFFQMMRRTDGTPRVDDKLTIASIDIGGGTTDLVITDFNLDGPAGNVFIIPRQRFRDGFKVAGDDILLQVIQKFAIPALEAALKSHGVAQPAALLSRLIGSEAKGDVRVNSLRQQLALQVLYPLGLRLLKEYEGFDPVNPASPGILSFGSLLAGDPPSSEVLSYVAGAVRRVAAGKPEFDLMATPLHVDLRRMHELFRKDGLDICKTIRALCEVVYAYRCDVLLLTGRPSRLPGIQALFRALLPVPPGRLIPLHDYRTGGWYPFHRLEKVGDPKTTAAVGAMLCAVGQGRLINFNFVANDLRPYSTVKIIGQMDHLNFISKANEYYRDVDLDSEAYELPDQPFEMRGAMRLGFRQIKAERWPASPLYTISFADGAREKAYQKIDQERDGKREPILVSLTQARSGGKASESFKVAGSARGLNLQLNTLANVDLGETNYWLDSGIVYRVRS